jgi:hypothetical protein
MCGPSRSQGDPPWRGCRSPCWSSWRPASRRSRAIRAKRHRDNSPRRPPPRWRRSSASTSNGAASRGCPSRYGPRAGGGRRASVRRTSRMRCRPPPRPSIALRPSPSRSPRWPCFNTLSKGRSTSMGRSGTMFRRGRSRIRRSPSGSCSATWAACGGTAVPARCSIPGTFTACASRFPSSPTTRSNAPPARGSFIRLMAIPCWAWPLRGSPAGRSLST